MVLTALRLPGNIEQRLSALATTLFRTHGIVSARALPPLVPLLWSDTPPPLEATGAAPLPALTLGGLALTTAGIVVELAPAAPVSELVRALEGGLSGPDATAAPDATATPDAATAPAAPPFPVGPPAVLLAPGVDQEAAGPALSDLETDVERALRGVVVRSLTLCTFEIKTWRGESPELVLWEEVRRRPLRKRRGP